MEPEKTIVVPLHHCWKYLDLCCTLLNKEWPRSTTARMHSLTVSCDNLPTSLILVLIKIDTNEELVIGHSKISPLHRIPSACFVESVVIAKKFRNKGWGRYIMQETEKYAKTIGKSVIYLSTSDKEKFYAKIGYNECEPVSIYGGKSIVIKNNLICSLFEKTSLESPNKCPVSVIAPPPPPPPPQSKLYSSLSITKVYMTKTLT